MLIRILFLISLVTFGSIGAAEPDLSHPLTLAELIDIAMDHHPATKQAWWNAKRAAAAVGIAKAPCYPQLSAEGFLSHGREFKYINGPDTTYTIVGADLILSLLLYDFGETDANVKAAKAALRAANWQTDWTIQKVMVDVLENAYALLHAQEVVLATLFSLEDAERMLHTSLELNGAGLTPISDVYVTKAAYAQMKMDLAEKKAFVDIQKGKLAASLGLPADTPIELALLNTLQTPKKCDVAELISLAYRQRTDLMAKRARLTESFANQRAVQAAYSPKFALAGRGGAEHAFHEKENGLHYDITVNISVPIFNGFQTMYDKRIAFVEAKLSKEELAQLELDIALEVLSNSRLLTAIEEMLPDAETDLENSQKAYESMLEVYKGGKVRITEVSQAQRQLAMARVRYSDSKTRWFIAMAKLAYATGTLDPYLETQCKKDL